MKHEYGSSMSVDAAGDPALLNSLGNQLSNAGRVEEAIAAYRAVLRVDAGAASVYSNLGLALQKIGRLDEAIEAHKTAVNLLPTSSIGQSNLGLALLEAGEIPAAIAALERATELDGRSPEAWNNLGVGLTEADRLEEAVEALRQAVALRPEYAQAHNNLGNVLGRLKQTEASIIEYRLAIALRTVYPEAHNNLGIALKEAELYDESIASYAVAIKQRPEFAEAFNNLGAALAAKGELNQAVKAYRRAIELRTEYPEAHTNLAVTLCDLGEGEAAIQAARRAIELRPGLAKAHSNLAQLLLTLGHFPEGWKEYEWRWFCDPNYPRPAYSQPMWDGSHLNGQRLLIHVEQGFGDAIWCARFVPIIQQQLGGRVILQCRPELTRLLKTLNGAAQVIAWGEKLPEFDVQIPLMSLPGALGITMDKIPAEVPYLQGDAQPWEKSLGERCGRRRVGIVWAGRPTHNNDRNRSMPAEKLAPLAEVANIQWHSLQKGSAAADVGKNGLEMMDHVNRLKDFADTASLISALDLVIAVDTAVAHLAGALGKPTWVMLPFAAEWRWMQQREDSPWYPTMRLFRQNRWGDWDGVVQRLAEELRKFVQSW